MKKIHTKIKLPKLRDAIFLPPNIITMVRILFVPIIACLIFFEIHFPGNHFSTIAAWLFIIAGITDFIDGYIARKMEMKSTVGKVLDPLADKLMVLCLMVLLIELDRVPSLLVAIIISREFIITALRTLASAAGIIISADKLGKIKTIFQIIAIPALLFDTNIFIIHSHIIGIISLYISVFFSLVSGYQYVKNFFILAKDKEF